MTDFPPVMPLLKPNRRSTRNCSFVPGDANPGGTGTSPVQTTRRGLLKLGTAILSGFVASALAVPIIGTVIDHAFRKRPSHWAKAGGIGSLSVNQPRRLSFPFETRDAYIRETVAHSVWVIKHSASEVTVFSPICPHLGCYYEWHPERKEFICPCHGSIYSIEGKVLGGPAPRSLDTLPHKLEGEELFVQWEVFKVGIREKVEV
jgi:menaquinol-cytochrome c reductase iron-sulfur subunit